MRACLVGGLLLFVIAAFAVGFGAGWLVNERLVHPHSADAATPAKLKETFEPFWETWDLIHRKYVEQPVDNTKLLRGAISGLLRSLGDPHTGYMDPEEYKIAQSDQSGELEGIGALVQGEGDYLRIVSPFPGSPAEAAGILPNDLVIAVDGVDIAGMDEFDVISMIRGAAGTTVHLTIVRSGHRQPLEFDIVRAKIDIPSVESKILPGNIAYVKINDFGDQTIRELRTALQDLLAQKPVGLVLDLRGNPGGYLNTAIEVVSQFIADGVVMKERHRDGREEIYRAQGGGLATKIPLMVLINAGSASASEIVAGAIQDRRRGLIIGEHSFGKGSVQEWHPLNNGDDGAVRITIAYWLTPNGRLIQKEGISPNVPVERTEEDIKASRDPQLDEAVRRLLAGDFTPPPTPTPTPLR